MHPSACTLSPSYSAIPDGTDRTWLTSSSFSLSLYLSLSLFLGRPVVADRHATGAEASRESIPGSATQSPQKWRFRGETDEGSIRILIFLFFAL